MRTNVGTWVIWVAGPAVRELAFGTRLLLDGDAYSVLSFNGPVVSLQRDDGRIVRMLVVSVLLGEYTVLDEQTSTAGEGVDERWKLDPSAVLGSLPPKVAASVERRRGDALEVLTGYRSQFPDPGERPRAAYSEAVTLTERVAAKAKERGVAPSTVWEWIRKHREDPVYGLVPKRYLRPVRADDRDARVLATTVGRVGELRRGTRINRLQLRLDIQMRLDAEFGAGVVELPPRTTFERKYLNPELKRIGYDTRARTKQGNARRPPTPWGWITAEQPGDAVFIDAWYLDVFACDPYTLDWVRVVVLVAIDCCTRQLVGWRFAPVDARQEDLVLLLREIVTPKQMRPGWSDKAAWRYPGVPKNLIYGEHKDFAGVAPMSPRSLIVDHAWIFRAHSFLSACELLRSNLYPARVLRPTDKATVERVLRTIRERLVQLWPGYKGPSLFERGVAVEEDALYFIPECEERFAEWVATDYHNKPHGGLRIRPIERHALSPNDAFDLAVSRSGYPRIPKSKDLFFELLPAHWNETIQDYGVEVHNGLRYDDPDGGLEDLRHERSPYVGEHAGDWPVKTDRRDLSRVYLRHPKSGDWLTLFRRGDDRDYDDRPFTDVEWAYARGLVAARLGRWPTRGEGERGLGELLARQRTRDASLLEERGRAKRAVIHKLQAAHDRQQAGVEKQLPAPAESEQVHDEPWPEDSADGLEEWGLV